MKNDQVKTKDEPPIFNISPKTTMDEIIKYIFEKQELHKYILTT